MASNQELKTPADNISASTCSSRKRKRVGSEESTSDKPLSLIDGQDDDDDDEDVEDDAENGARLESMENEPEAEVEWLKQRAAVLDIHNHTLQTDLAYQTDRAYYCRKYLDDFVWGFAVQANIISNIVRVIDKIALATNQNDPYQVLEASFIHSYDRFARDFSQVYGANLFPFDGDDRYRLSVKAPG